MAHALEEVAVAGFGCNPDNSLVHAAGIVGFDFDFGIAVVAVEQNQDFDVDMDVRLVPGMPGLPAVDGDIPVLGTDAAGVDTVDAGFVAKVACLAVSVEKEGLHYADLAADYDLDIAFSAQVPWRPMPLYLLGASDSPDLSSLPSLAHTKKYSYSHNHFGNSARWTSPYLR